MKKLVEQLKLLHQKGYKAYKSIQGRYEGDKFTLYIDYVQGDPFATPSKIRLEIPVRLLPIQAEWLKLRHEKTAVEDCIARAVGKAVSELDNRPRGSGHSGKIFFDKPGQEILERTAVMMNDRTVTVCMSVGLPANGRRINAKEATLLFASRIPHILNRSVFRISSETIQSAVCLVDQQAAIREELKRNQWVAFIANGSILPRESGISNLPLKNALPFQSPRELEVELTVPHREKPIKGMAIPRGITLIVGGGYHGKSTLLKAIERGVYFHAEGDGREFVITDPDAVKIRAEDGRSIQGVNISPFINRLPRRIDTTFFSTENASGSTSQAANVIEAVETGATVLLIDEDTSATNFMIRDVRMRELVSEEKEPITPFIDKIVALRDKFDISAVLVMGGSGDYFSVADTVIMMDEYKPKVVTEKVREINRKYPAPTETFSRDFGIVTHRQLHPSSLQTKKGKRHKTQGKELYTIIMGKTEIVFDALEQLVDLSQTRMIAEIIQYLERTNSLEGKTLTELLAEIDRKMDKDGLGFAVLNGDKHPGNLARPRKHEIAGVLNRMRTLKVIRQN